MLGLVCRVIQLVACNLLRNLACSSSTTLLPAPVCALQKDMDETQRWFMSPSLSDSWQAWNKDFTDVWSDVKDKQMGRLATAIRAHIMKLPTVLMLIAATYRLDLRKGSSISKAIVMIIIAGELHSIQPSCK